MQNRITKSIFHFFFILEFKTKIIIKDEIKEKKKKDYTTQKQFNSEKTKKEERKRRKEKEKIK